MLFLLSFFRQRGTPRLAGVLLAMAAAATPVAAASDESFYSVVESGVTVERAGDAQPAGEDQLVFAGDRLTTTFSARAEVILADAVIRVGGGSDVVFAALAEPADDGDADDNPHLLLLERGELLVASDGATAIRVDTDNATVFVRAGSCRIERDADATVMIVRSGEAELRTRQGTVVVAADERAWVMDNESPVVEPAGGADALERWAAALDARRERLASSSRVRSWWGGFWTVFWEDDGYDSVFHSVDIGDCDDGVTACRDGSGGGTARTRPPRFATDAGDTVENEPDVAAVTKPWPLDGAGPTEPVPFPIGKPPLDTDVSDSPVPSNAGVAVAGIEGPEAAPSKVSADEAPQPEAVSTADDTASTTATTSTDSGGFSPEPSASEALPPPEHGIEPNR